MTASLKPWLWKCKIQSYCGFNYTVYSQSNATTNLWTSHFRNTDTDNEVCTCRFEYRRRITFGAGLCSLSSPLVLSRILLFQWVFHFAPNNHQKRSQSAALTLIVTSQCSWWRFWRHACWALLPNFDPHVWLSTQPFSLQTCTDILHESVEKTIVNLGRVHINFLLDSGPLNYILSTNYFNWQENRR